MLPYLLLLVHGFNIQAWCNLEDGCFLAIVSSEQVDSLLWPHDVVQDEGNQDICMMQVLDESTSTFPVFSTFLRIQNHSSSFSLEVRSWLSHHTQHDEALFKVGHYHRYKHMGHHYSVTEGMFKVQRCAWTRWQLGRWFEICFVWVVPLG